MMEASKELSIKSSNASNLFLKFRFHDLHNPFPSTLVNGIDGEHETLLCGMEAGGAAVVAIAL